MSSGNEHPDRLERFLAALNSANWKEAPEAAISTVFTAVNDLIHHEILFYYRARNTHRRISLLTRILAILFGSAGALLPLLAGADAARWGAAGPYGYVLLAAAAAAMAVNRLFLMTDGHVRYVVAQLELEQLVTTFRLDWAAWRSNSAELSRQELEEAFNLLRAFANSAYKVIREETTMWGDSLTKALKEYADSVEAARSRSGTEAENSKVVAQKP